MSVAQPARRAPRVSVVMPVYNTERYIAGSIRSALAAGEPEMEVLVVDDGSTDRSVEEARSVGDARVTVIHSGASGGPSRPRNVGLRHSRAPYISLLDSDDLLKPDKLAASIAALDRCPSAGFAFGNYERMDADGNVFETSFDYAYPVFRALEWQPAGEEWRLIRQRDLAHGLLYENFIGTSGVVMRRELALSLGGFDESLANGDDLDLWFRLAHAGDALYCPSVGHSYRVHAASVVHRPMIRNAVSRITVLRRERARWRTRAERRQLDRRIAENLAVIGYQQRLQRKRWQAVRSCLQAYTTSPELRWLTTVIAAALLGARDARSPPATAADSRLQPHSPVIERKHHADGRRRSPGFADREYRTSRDAHVWRTPRVSVVVPTYNTERFVGAAIRSALEAGEPEVEVIVVDDGSTDGSLEAARAIDDPRVIVIPIAASGGPARPRNVGIARARAPYVSLLDSDDLLKPGRLAASVDALERWPQAGFVFGNFERMDIDGNVFQTSVTYAYPVFRGLRSEPLDDDWRLIPQAELARGLLYENFIGTGGVVLRRQLLTKLGAFDESIVYAEDLDLWFRLAHHCAALYSPRVSYSYRDRPESLTYRVGSRGARDRIAVLEREKDRWSDHSARRQLDHLIARNLAGLGYEERSRRHRLRSMAMFASAFATSPDARWLRGMLGSAIPQRARSRHL